MKPPPKAAKGSPIVEYPAALSDSTVRMIVRVSTGGHRVRIEIANSHGAAAVNIAVAHIARSGEAASIVPGSDRVLMFGGRKQVVIPPGASTVAAFGDSITDGFGTSPDKDQAWPTLLDTRLRAAPRTARIGVVNLGISGNRVLHDTAGASALARFDRDVLALEGVGWVVLLEGINDISYSAIPGFPASERVSAQDLIAGYRMLIAKAHMHGLKMIGATILPYQGVWTYTAEGEAVRERVNEWIRTGGEFDATVDFDKATRDPANPKRLRAAFDSGDHVHPNDAGNQAMANAFNLSAFQ
ncbi:MAG TPA: SGNH/GDSL hydrolase family protein [Steroidobacteraceae bacterium]